MKTFLIVISLLMNGLALAQSNWPLINYDAYNSKWAKSETKLKPPLKLVKAFGEADGAIAYFNGVVYSGYSDTPNRVVAYSLDTEQELWRFAIPGSRAGMGFSPAISDSIVLAGAQVSDSLYALNRFTGKVVWRLETYGLYARNACITDDRVYILGNRLYCLDLKSGREIWRFIMGGQTSPAVDGEHVYIGGRVINKETSLEVYSFSMQGMDPIVLDDAHFYYTAKDSLFAVAKGTWKKKWAAPIPQGLWNNLYGGCTAVTDKTVTFVLWANWPAQAAIYTLNKENGQELWRYSFADQGVYKPTIANGIVYVVTFNGGILWGFDVATGEIEFKETSRAYREYAIVADGKLFVSGGGKICVFENDPAFVAEEKNTLPADYRLEQNFPNPFNHSTIISFTLPRSAHTRITIYNASGQWIARLDDQERGAGHHELVWDGKDSQGKSCPSGIYFYQMEADDFVSIRKMVLIL